MDTVGQFICDLTYKGHTVNPVIYVIRGLKTNLLGLQTLRVLNLIARVDSIKQYEEKIHLQYGDLFKALGTLGPEYTIQLKPDAKPYALNTPRNVPLP